jgi:hypothetical protein
MKKSFPESPYELGKVVGGFLCRNAGKAALSGSILFAGYAALPHGPTYSEEHNDKVIGCARVYASPTSTQTPWKADVKEDCHDIFKDYENSHSLSGNFTITDYRLPLSGTLVAEQRWGEAEDAAHTEALFEDSFRLLALGLGLEGAAAFRRRMKFDQELQSILVHGE